MNTLFSERLRGRDDVFGTASRNTVDTEAFGR